MKTPIALYVNVTEGQAKTSVSRRISYPFRLGKIRINFPIGSENNVQIKVFVSDDEKTADNTMPNGVDIFSLLSIDGPIRGNAEVVEMNCDIEFKEGNKYIHVYLKNNDTNDHCIVVVVEIESLSGRH